MKRIFIKTAVAGLMALGLASCADDLNISSIDPNTSSAYDPEELLAKQYATLAVTGQVGPNGNGDISGDEGEIGFWRLIFNLQELCTDECIWAWQDNEDIPTLTYIAWSSSSTRVNWAWQRLAFNITLFNQFIYEQTGKMDDDIVAEVRFLRALHYWEFLDLFHAGPFKVDFNFELAGYKTGAELYAWLDQELTEIESQLKPAGTYNNSSNFGRADAGAAYALHARLALNSEAYTNGAVKDYQKAIDYSNKVISCGAYDLSRTAKNGYSGYAQVFMGDNDYNPEAMKEIIFPIRQDGVKTQSYAGSTYLIAATRGAGMPYLGTSAVWTCIFARQNLIAKFFNNPADCPAATADELDASKLPTGTEAEVIAADNQLGGSTAEILAAANDDRALFYAGVGGGTRTLSPGKQITGWLNGYSIVKWQNLRADQSNPSNASFMDTDIPLFRLAEMYLTRAEAEWRLGQSDKALADLNELRNRAHAPVFTSVTEDILCDEWCREFYLEGRRRSDLVRFGRFTSSKYLWDFKGTVPAGTGVDSHYNVYPLPADEVAGNPALVQNPGY